MRNSIATRLALMFAAAALVGFVVLGFALHRVLAGELARHQQAQIETRLEDISYMLQHGRAQNLGGRIRDKLDTLGGADPRMRTWMWSEDPSFRFGDDVADVMAAIDAGRDSVDVRVPDSAQVLSLIHI